MLTHIHPSRIWFTCRTRPIFNGDSPPGSESGTRQDPPGAQSPFASSRCYLLLCDVLQHFNLSAPHFSTPRQALQRGGWHSVISLCIQSLNSTVRASSTTKCDICVTSEEATPPSSLLLTHAPDQNPLAGFGCPYSDESLQVVASPCWEMALPDIISTILA
jgi:hypothetical protein